MRHFHRGPLACLNFPMRTQTGGHVKSHAGLRLSCHFRVDLLSFCVDEEQTRQTSVKGGPAEAASLGWCFVQMCSIVEGHILCWQIGLSQCSLLSAHQGLSQCSLRQLSGCLGPKPCLSPVRESVVIDYRCLLPGNQKWLTRSAQISR